MHERALYAAHSGNLPRLLAACDSWPDYVWAYLRVYVDQMMEQEVRLNGSTPPVYRSNGGTMHKLPEGYMEKM